MASLISPSPQYPLAKVEDSHLKQLARVLWSWTFCVDCDTGKQCTSEACPGFRLKRLGQFFQYYKDLTASYERDDEESAALNEHDDLFEIIRGLKADPGVTRAELAERLFANRTGGRKPPAPADQERAINIAVRVLAGINCAGNLEDGMFQVSWRSDVTFTQFITDAFPQTDHPGLDSTDTYGSAMEIRAAVMARKLKKHLGLKFRPTDDLRSHLKLDRKSNTVELYHHTAFLKEHLRLTVEPPHNRSISDSLKLGALPRSLALEALDTIQQVLFPLSEVRSRSLLSSLVSTASLDPDCLRFESDSVRNPDEEDIAYHYFGARLADLYEELQNPKPRGWVEKWLERKSGARYVMLATLAGVITAVLLGLGGLSIAIYQAWVGYQAWQHPVHNN